MKKGYVEVAFVLDETGSMHEIKEDTIGGFNQWLEEQKELDVEEMRCSLVLFSKIEDEKTYRIRHQGIPIGDVEKLDDSTYRPRGTTPLLDAIGITIDRLGTRLDNMDEAEKPEKVIVAILTDGRENASEEYTLERVKEMVTHQQEKYSWNFIFLGVGIDAFAAGGQMGIAARTTRRHDRSGQGVRQAYTDSHRMMRDIIEKDDAD
ncbi:MAG: vWA domain-containing protein [bacterium]